MQIELLGRKTSPEVVVVVAPVADYHWRRMHHREVERTNRSIEVAIAIAIDKDPDDDGVEEAMPLPMSNCNVVPHYYKVKRPQVAQEA